MHLAQDAIRGGAGSNAQSWQGRLAAAVGRPRPIRLPEARCARGSARAGPRSRRWSHLGAPAGAAAGHLRGVEAQAGDRHVGVAAVVVDADPAAGAVGAPAAEAAGGHRRATAAGRRAAPSSRCPSSHRRCRASRAAGGRRRAGREGRRSCSPKRIARLTGARRVDRRDRDAGRQQRRLAGRAAARGGADAAAADRAGVLGAASVVVVGGASTRSEPRRRHRRRAPAGNAISARPTPIAASPALSSVLARQNRFLLRRPTGLAVGLALKEPAPPRCQDSRGFAP